MKSIEIIMIPAHDRQKSKEFYKQIGFEVRVAAIDPHGAAWIQVGLPGDDASISLAGFHAIICETTDIEKESAELKAKGIEIGKIDSTPYGRFAWMKDPDGNGVCLRENRTVG